MQQLTKTLAKGRPFFDIAANLTDDQFGSNKHHHSDRDEVVQRAIDVGCSHLLIAAGCYKDAEHAFDLCNRYNNAYCTIGVHPCRANEPFNKAHHHSLEDYFVKLDHQA
jgi:TatD DNase family protein